MSLTSDAPMVALIIQTSSGLQRNDWRHDCDCICTLSETCVVKCHVNSFAKPNHATHSTPDLMHLMWCLWWEGVHKFTNLVFRFSPQLKKNKGEQIATLSHTSLDITTSGWCVWLITTSISLACRLVVVWDCCSLHSHTPLLATLSYSYFAMICLWIHLMTYLYLSIQLTNQPIQIAFTTRGQLLS